MTVLISSNLCSLVGPIPKSTLVRQFKFKLFNPISVVNFKNFDSISIIGVLGPYFVKY